MAGNIKLQQHKNYCFVRLGEIKIKYKASIKMKLLELMRQKISKIMRKIEVEIRNWFK